mgnify:CR=1 FL=1
MGFVDAVTGWFKREAGDVKASVDRLESDLDTGMSRKERELDATPEERMAMIQEESSADDALAAIRDKIDGVQAHAEANAELIETDPESESE